MAFIPEFACGWEMGYVPKRPGKFVVDSANVNCVTGGHTGTYCLELNNFFRSPYFYVIRDTPSAQVDVAVWARHIFDDGDARIHVLVDGSTRVELRYNAGRHWDAYVSGSPVATGGVILVNNTWQHIQLRVTIAAEGSVQTRINGMADIDYSGNTGAGSINQVGMMINSTGPEASSLYCDDFVFGEGGWPGDLRIDPLIINADTATKEWTPSTGSDNYAVVDERPASTSDYVSTTADARDLYELAAWDDDGGSKTPIGLTVWAYALKMDASFDDKLRLLQSDGANEAQSGYLSFLTPADCHFFFRVTDPAGGSWSKADLDDLKIGIEADMA